MKQLLKLLDYLFVLKPVLLYPVWTLFIAGYYVQAKVVVAAENVATNGTATDPSGPNVLLVGAAVTLLMGAIFVINQVMERNKLESRSRMVLIAPDHLTPKVAFIEAALLLAASLVIGFISGPLIGVLLLVILVLAGILYNFHPFSLKDRPVSAFLTTGLVSFLIFALGWLVAGAPTTQLGLFSIPYVFMILAVYVYASIEEEKPGPGQKKSTLSERAKIALYTGLVLEITALVIAFVLKDEFVFYPLLFSLPFFIWAIMRLTPQDLGRAINYPVFLLALTLSFKQGLAHSGYSFFLILLAVYFLSKLYYRLRFGINFPNLASTTATQLDAQ